MAHKEVTVAEMKELAKAKKLQVNGSKNDLAKRLSTYFKDDSWVDEIVKGRNARKNVVNKSGAGQCTNDENNFNENDQTQEDQDRTQDRSSDDDEGERRYAIRMEIQLLEERKRLMEIECQLQQREMDLLRRERQVSSCEIPEASDNVSMNANIKLVASLIGEYDGNTENFEIWEKQLRLVKDAYNLTNDAAKIVISMKLKGKAIEWFRSKAEHISISFDNIINELKRMFCANQCKIELRRKFEKRTWEKGETFREYAHEKIILGNKVPISDEGMLIYLTDGIPDRTLYYQTRTHKFKQREDLIDAFGEIILHDYRLDQT